MYIQLQVYHQDSEGCFLSRNDWDDLLKLKSNLQYNIELAKNRRLRVQKIYKNTKCNSQEQGCKTFYENIISYWTFFKIDLAQDWVNSLNAVSNSEVANFECHFDLCCDKCLIIINRLHFNINLYIHLITFKIDILLINLVNLIQVYYSKLKLSHSALVKNDTSPSLV